MSVYDKDLPSSQGIYHKFEDKVTYLFRLYSEPIVVVSEYKGTENTKYAWLAWNVEEEVPQLVRLPKTGAQHVWDYARDADYGDPTKYNMKMTRSGSLFDTTYNIKAGTEKKELPQAAIDALEKIDPIAMLSKGQGIVDVYWLADAEDPDRKRAEKQPAPVDTPEPKDPTEDEPF